MGELRYQLYYGGVSDLDSRVKFNLKRGYGKYSNKWFAVIDGQRVSPEFEEMIYPFFDRTGKLFL